MQDTVLSRGSEEAVDLHSTVGLFPRTHGPGMPQACSFE